MRRPPTYYWSLALTKRRRRKPACLSPTSRSSEDNKDEIEALQILYSRPYRAGLRYGQIKELDAAIKRPPLHASRESLWTAYQALESSRGYRSGGERITDVISLVKHAIDPGQPLKPFAASVQERYEHWLAEQEAAGASFTPE